jgi:hypothetical protein
MELEEIFMRKIKHITLYKPFASLLGVAALTCAGVAAADTVRVTNPATQPVLTSRVDEPARVPYQVQLTGPSAITCGNILTTATCEGRINGVPAGKRLVIQSVSGSLISNSPPTNGQILVTTELPSVGYYGVPSISILPNIIDIPGQPSFTTGDSNVIFQSHLTVYVDGGTRALVSVTVSGPSSAAAPSIIVSGYVIDCTAAPCEPIVTQ